MHPAERALHFLCGHFAHAWDAWLDVQQLFQLTHDDIARVASDAGDNVLLLADLRSYLFAAVELSSHADMAAITRRLSLVFPMPLVVIFKLRAQLTFVVVFPSSSNEDDADALQKVTLIRNVDIANPHAGHLDTLVSLAHRKLHQSKCRIRSFDALRTAWERALDVERLSKRFYREIAAWYLSALDEIEPERDRSADSHRV
ncbi:putative type IIS restriction /modification enzyme, N-terminal half [Candidatus Paraburkholderia calva]|nr:putative type IIS restriction /modification enzyme, N-terminal half [Candidatus Paraburkholderia calva]